MIPAVPRAPAGHLASCDMMHAVLSASGFEPLRSPALSPHLYSASENGHVVQESRMTSTWKERCYPILDGGWEPVIV